VEVKAEYRPERAASAAYGELADEFVNLYKRTKSIHKRLNGGRLESAG
jgi:hypothetical protein